MLSVVLFYQLHLSVGWDFFETFPNFVVQDFFFFLAATDWLHFLIIIWFSHICLILCFEMDFKLLLILIWNSLFFIFKKSNWIFILSVEIDWNQLIYWKNNHIKKPRMQIWIFFRNFLLNIQLFYSLKVRHLHKLL